MMRNVDFFLICVITCSRISVKDSRMICKQKEFGELRVLVCPPINHTETAADLGYCCSNNGLMDCCSYDDYRHRHVGPDLMTTMVMIAFQIGLVVVLVVWIYRCRGHE